MKMFYAKYTKILAAKRPRYLVLVQLLIAYKSAFTGEVNFPHFSSIIPSQNFFEFYGEFFRLWMLLEHKTQKHKGKPGFFWIFYQEPFNRGRRLTAPSLFFKSRSPIMLRLRRAGTYS